MSGVDPRLSEFSGYFKAKEPGRRERADAWATAVFAIKYLRSLGYSVTNNMFKENSWYFRNALVRANYADYARGVKREWSYLEAFFRNLLLGEKNELKSRYLLIGIDRPPPKFDGGGVVKVVRKSGKKKAVRKWLSEFGNCCATSRN